MGKWLWILIWNFFQKPSFSNHSGNQRLKGRLLPSSLPTTTGADLLTHNLCTWISVCFWIQMEWGEAESGGLEGTLPPGHLAPTGGLGFREISAAKQRNSFCSGKPLIPISVTLISSLLSLSKGFSNQGVHTLVLDWSKRTQKKAASKEAICCRKRSDWGPRKALKKCSLRKASAMNFVFESNCLYDN